MKTASKTPGDSLNSQKPFVLSKGFIRLWLAALIMVAVFIRMYGATDYYYTADEAVVRNMAEGASPGEVWQFSHDEAPAPLGNLLRHYWLEISDAPWFARLESLLFGIALIPLYYRIGLLLAGELCGLACATLIAFSHGAIIQSYVVRNYCFFAFFLSCHFLAYLQWRVNRSAAALLRYGAWGCLAALTNISAVFAVMCTAAFETLCLRLKKSPWRVSAQWLCVNFIVILVATGIYILWKPLLTPLKSYFVQYQVTPHTIVSKTLLYPLAQSEYMFPSQLSALALFLCMGVSAFLWRKRADAAPFYSMLALALLSFALGMFLLATNAYPYLGTRRGIWALPFLITAAGTMVSRLCASLAVQPARMRQGVAMAFILAGCLLYSPGERFRDGAEYALPWKEWDAADKALQSLSPSDLIVTERDDGALLANLYRPIGNDAFSGATMVATAPYRSLRILYNPYYPRSYSTAVFLANLKEARQKGLLKPPGRLAFFRTAWSRSPLTDLMLCPALEKTVLTFPALGSEHTLTRDDIQGSYISMMLVQKQALLDDVLSPHGKARGCLDGVHDMVPGFMPGR